MKKQHVWWSLALASLFASSAGAVEFFMPAPYLGGNFVYRTEFARTDLGKNKVYFTYVAEGKSGLGLPSAQYTVLPGPSTSTTHPMLTDNKGRDFHPGRSDPKYFLPGGGLVVLEGEPGLLAIESAVMIGGDPATAWELPLLTKNDAFDAGTTAYVLNLMKGPDVGSQLSIYNLDGSPATCSARLLTAQGILIDERTGIHVPSIGGVRIADITSKVASPTASGMNAAVTCDHPFYAIGSFPAKAIAEIKVHYPSAEPPNAGTAETLVFDPLFRVTRDKSVRTYQLPLVGGVRYHSIVIDFDVTATDPTNAAYYRGLIGMWRPEPGLRFGKTLFFGVNERWDRSKLLVDLGTPFIEVMTKRGKAPLIKGKTYHFRIEVSSDQQSFHMRVTKAAGGALVADMQSGLFNTDLVTKNGNTLVVGIGLPGIADGAYSPPYGWRFTQISIKGYR